MRWYAEGHWIFWRNVGQNARTIVTNINEFGIGKRRLSQQSNLAGAWVESRTRVNSLGGRVWTSFAVVYSIDGQFECPVVDDLYAQRSVVIIAHDMDGRMARDTHYVVFQAIANVQGLRRHFSRMNTISIEPEYPRQNHKVCRHRGQW